MEISEHIRGSGISETPLNTEQIADLVRVDTSGAVVMFEGAVRNHADGKGVDALEYSGHPDADKVIRSILEEVAERNPECYLAAYHRVGKVDIGGLALVAAVSSAHRTEAFAAIQDLVNTVKEKLPIWKFQQFSDGTDEWVGSA